MNYFVLLTCESIMKGWGSETRVLAPALTFPSEVTLENHVNFFGPQSPHLLKKKKKLVNHGLRLCQELFSLPMSAASVVHKCEHWKTC